VHPVTISFPDFANMKWILLLWSVSDFPQFSSGSLVYGFFGLFIAAWTICQLSGGCNHYRLQGCKFRPMLRTFY
jgi:hypothetical protein